MYTVCHPFSPDWSGRTPDKQKRSHETDCSISWAKVLHFFQMCKSRAVEKWHFVLHNTFWTFLPSMLLQGGVAIFSFHILAYPKKKL